MSFHLREARSTDAGKLGAIISEAVQSAVWKPKLHSSAEDIAHMGDLIARGWVTICESGSGDVAGFMARDGHAIQSLYVKTTAQNAGIGTALLEHAKTQVDQLELWTFVANTGAQRLYQRQAFREVERTDGAGNEEGLPDMRLVWTRSVKETADG